MEGKVVLGRDEVGRSGVGSLVGIADEAVLISFDSLEEIVVLYCLDLGVEVAATTAFVLVLEVVGRGVVDVDEASARVKTSEAVEE